MHRLIVGLAILLLSVSLGACGSGADPIETGLDRGPHPVPQDPVPVPPDPPDDPAPPPDVLTGGVLVTLDVQGEVFRWWITNDATADAIRDMWRGTRPMTSMGGVLRDSPGHANHNTPWTWHVDPELNGVDVLTVPESPWLPSQCEGQKAHWLAVGTTFIPMGPQIVDVQDYR